MEHSLREFAYTYNLQPNFGTDVLSLSWYQGIILKLGTVSACTCYMDYTRNRHYNEEAEELEDDFLLPQVES